MVRDIFKRAAYMTRYGRFGFDEAMALPAWYRREAMDAIQELLEEESKASGLSVEDLD